MRINRASARVLALATLSLLLCARPALPQALEYDIKAALLFKIGKFIRWPDGSLAGGNLQLCIIGHDDFGASADALAGKRLQGQSVTLLRLKAQQSATGCHIVFVSRSEHEHVTAILASLARQPVLTVSDIDGFAALGGIVGFATRDKKISFEINPGASKRAGLEVSAQLLQLATLVGDAHPEATP